jgi:hypothetical protein
MNFFIALSSLVVSLFHSSRDLSAVSNGSMLTNLADSR